MYLCRLPWYVVVVVLAVAVAVVVVVAVVVAEAVVGAAGLLLQPGYTARPHPHRQTH
jgi:hypothetical protein